MFSVAKISIVLHISLIFTENICSDSVDYCNAELCPHQGRHIRCDNDGSFSDKCVGQFRLVNMTKLIPLILAEHNFYRNLLASGQLQCFYPAVKMPALVWNDKLSEMAEYNVKTCVFEHDPCRSTVAYPYSGQNIYFAKTKKMNVSTAQFITEAIYLWFEEYLDADYTVMESYRQTSPQTGHFTTLMNDRQDSVGCAFLENILPNGKKRQILFTCNYPSTNIRKLPSYRPGKTGSQCKRPHRVYKSLCADKIDPNEFKQRYAI